MSSISSKPGNTDKRPRRWAVILALVAVAVVVAGLLMLSAPRPRAHVFSHGREIFASPHRVLPRPPADITAHAGAIAGRLHTAGLLVLIAGILAALATAWLWRTRPGSNGSGYTPTAV